MRKRFARVTWFKNSHKIHLCTIYPITKLDQKVISGRSVDTWLFVTYNVQLKNSFKRLKTIWRFETRLWPGPTILGWFQQWEIHCDLVGIGLKFSNFLETLWSFYNCNILHLARRLRYTENTKNLIGDEETIFCKFRSVHHYSFEFIILPITEADDVENKGEILVFAKFRFVTSKNALREWTLFKEKCDL